MSLIHASAGTLVIAVWPPAVFALRYLILAEHGAVAPKTKHNGAAVNPFGNQCERASVGSNGLLGARLPRAGNVEVQTCLLGHRTGQ